MTAPADSGPATAGAREVLDFWRAVGSERWFEPDARLDAEIAQRFSPLWQAAARGSLAHWEATPDGALALVIVLDQFPRNMFRERPNAYETDALARAVADRAIARAFDLWVSPALRQFFYLPFMHSEALADQERCIGLAQTLGDDEFAKYAHGHADIIRRFGRFPHRNAVLGRETTPEERAFLDAGGFGS
jgi:uncharacterized protein (DUF924 family)